MKNKKNRINICGCFPLFAFPLSMAFAALSSCLALILALVEDAVRITYNRIAARLGGTRLGLLALNKAVEEQNVMLNQTRMQKPLRLFVFREILSACRTSVILQT